MASDSTAARLSPPAPRSVMGLAVAGAVGLSSSQEDLSRLARSGTRAQSTEQLVGAFRGMTSASQVGSRLARQMQSAETRLNELYRDALADWLKELYPETDIDKNNFLDRIESGALLCRLAVTISTEASQWVSGVAPPHTRATPPVLKSGSRSDVFYARDSITRFLKWTREIGVPEAVQFETADVIERRNEKNILNCLMEVARRSPHLLHRPQLVVFEEDIRREQQSEEGGEGAESPEPVEQQKQPSTDSGEHDNNTAPPGDAATGTAPPAATTTATADSAAKAAAATTHKKRKPRARKPSVEHSAVLDTVGKVAPATAVEDLGNGRFRIGGEAVHVRVFKTHVVVRVGGGWQPLSDFLYDNPAVQTGMASALSTDERAIEPELHAQFAVATEDDAVPSLTKVDVKTIKSHSAPQLLNNQPADQGAPPATATATAAATAATSAAVPAVAAAAAPRHLPGRGASAPLLAPPALSSQGDRKRLSRESSVVTARAASPLSSRSASSPRVSPSPGSSRRQSPNGSRPTSTPPPGGPASPKMRSASSPALRHRAPGKPSSSDLADLAAAADAAAGGATTATCRGLVFSTPRSPAQGRSKIPQPNPAGLPPGRLPSSPQLCRKDSRLPIRPEHCQ